MRGHSENYRDKGSSAESIRPAGPGYDVPGLAGQPDVQQPGSEVKHPQLGPTQAELEAERFFWSILDQSPDALFLYDLHTELIVDANRNACESLGYEREELIGKTPRDFDPNVMRDESFLLRTNERLFRGETFSFETLHRRKDGAEFPVEVRVRQIDYDGRALVLAQVRDIAERKAAEQEHLAYVRFLESLQRVSRAMQSTDDLWQMLDYVLSLVVEVFECDCAVLGTLSREPEIAFFTVEGKRDRKGFESEVVVGNRYPVSEELRELARALDVAGGPVQYLSTTVPPMPPGLWERVALQSALSMRTGPGLEQRDHFLLLGQSSHQRTWTADELRLFREIGLRMGESIARLSLLQTLRLSESRLEEAERLAQVGWWERDLLTNRVYLSEELRRLFGLEHRDLATMRQQHWLNLIHPDDRQRAVNSSANALRGGEGGYDLNYRLVRADGTERLVHSHGEVKRDTLGRPARIFGTLQDITGLWRAEQALRTSEARFRTFVDHATDSFFLHNEQLDIVDVNRQACEILGYTREELIGMGARDIDVQLGQPSVTRLRELLGDEVTVSFETLQRRKDGTRLPVEVRARRFQQDGRVHYLCLVRDITERTRTERRLAAQHLVSRVLAESESSEVAVPQILQIICESLDWDVGSWWQVDREAGVLRCAQLWRKPALEDLAFEAATWTSTFGPGVGLPGRVWASRVPACIPDVLEDQGYLRAPAARLDGLHAAFAFPILLRGEVLAIIDLISCEVRQPDRDLLDTMANVGSQIGQFIERKRAETSLQSAQAELAHVARVTTMGELTASIAHEVNQPLGAMVTSAAAGARWLAADPPQLEKVQRALERIVRDGKRAAQVIGRVRSLLKRQAPQMELLDVNETIREAVTLTRDQARRQAVALHARLAEGLAPVRGDRVQLLQVLLNLIVNAFEAMSAIEDRPRELTIVTRGDGPGALGIEVQDTGPGVDPTRAEELFEAFHTTKPEGIGMGLAISRSIIEAHGGRLSARPNQPHGAVFVLSLPFEPPSR